jgi:uncharacterized membrane protein
MDTDLFFVVGVIIAVFSIPSIVSALTDGRAPRIPALMIIIGGLMIGYAMQQRPGVYGLETLPDTFVRVVAGIL